MFYLVSVLSAAASSLSIIIIILFKADTCVMARAQAVKSLWCKRQHTRGPMCLPQAGGLQACDAEYCLRSHWCFSFQPAWVVVLKDTASAERRSLVTHYCVAEHNAPWKAMKGQHRPLLHLDPFLSNMVGGQQTGGSRMSPRAGQAVSGSSAMCQCGGGADALEQDV